MCEKPNTITHVTAEGAVVDVIAFHDDAQIRKHLIALGPTIHGDAWWDNYDERQRVANLLHAAYLAA